MAAIMCATMVKAGDPENKHKVEHCGQKAKWFIAAFGGKSWDGYYCDKHAPWIIKRRLRLIRKYKQSVVMRVVTPYDKKRIKERRKRK